MYEYKIKEILKIYDDTIIVKLDLGFGVIKTEKLRFILTPEIRGPKGLKSRDWLKEKIYQAIENQHDIIVKTFKDHKGKDEKYIAEININKININKQLVAEGLASYTDY